jgi:hypothetical protein
MTDLPTTLAITVALAALFAAIVSILLMFLSRSRLEKYDREHNIAVLEKMRESFEVQLYNINNRLLATEDRWKDVNHLLISSQRFQSTDKATTGEVRLSGFLKSAGLKEEDLVVDKKLVFVLTPYHPEHRKTYDVISEVCKEAGLSCMRGDEEFIGSDILSHILKLMVKANVIIANVDGRNPNVSYELGIAHAIDKPVVIVSRTQTTLPFDVQSKRIILYKRPGEMKLALKNELIKTLIRE